MGETFAGGRLWTLLVGLFLVNVLSQIDRILPFILAESIRSELNLSDTQIGLVTGLAFAVCYALLSLPLARAADRGSPRGVLVACIGLWSTMTALGGLATGFVVLALTRFGVAFGEAGAIPAGHALIARRVPMNRRGLALGVFSMGIPLGTMTGFVLGGVLDQAIGWRWTFFAAGGLGLVIALLTFLVAGPTPRLERLATGPTFLRSAGALLRGPAFRGLVLAALLMGFAAAPFYAFMPSFLIRTHGFSSGEAGLTIGLLQGLMGVGGAILGGRGFDRAARAASRRLLLYPGLVFLIGAATTAGALNVSQGWLAATLLLPAMFAFSYMLPWGFGAAHLVAGRGREALASSLVVIATGLFGPALAPVLVGAISDAATGAGLANGLGLALLLVPIASLLTGWALIRADLRLAAARAEDGL